MDGVEVVGTFNAAAWFDTLALILSRKTGADIKVKVTLPTADEQDGQPERR